MKWATVCLLIVALVFCSACTSQMKPTAAPTESSKSSVTSTTASTTIRPTNSSIKVTTIKSESTGTKVSSASEANPLTGLWTDDSSGMSVTVDERGLPVGDIFEGEWYSFHPDGSFFRLYYTSGTVVSGILIQEGLYQVSKNDIHLTKCTESFFRDQWEEQPEYYRVSIEDRTLQFRLAKLQGQAVVYIKSPVRDTEQLYFRARK